MLSLIALVLVQKQDKMNPFARRITATAATALLSLLSACTSPAVVPGVSASKPGDLDGHYFTYPRASGNRVIDGAVKGTFPNNIQTYDVSLPANITWVVASHHPAAGFKYVVTTKENKAYVIHPPTKSGAPAIMEELVDFQSSGDQPPLIRHKGLNEPPVIVTLPPQTAKVSPLSHPVPSGEGVYAFIEEDTGDLVLWNLVQTAEIGRMAGIMLGTILGVSVVLVGLIAVVFGRRRSSRKEMDSATMPQTTFNRHGVLDGMNDLELAADADMHAN